MAHPNAEPIERFYQAFQHLDGEAMAACYAPQTTFHDPASGELRGREVGDTWCPLTGRARDFRLDYVNAHVDQNEGHTQWMAYYLSIQTGRGVENRIETRFRPTDGLVVEHHDQFDLWRWNRQALGIKGLLLGWAPSVQRAIHRQARKGLAVYQIAHSAADRGCRWPKRG